MAPPPQERPPRATPRRDGGDSGADPWGLGPGYYGGLSSKAAPPGARAKSLPAKAPPPAAAPSPLLEGGPQLAADQRHTQPAEDATLEAVRQQEEVLNKLKRRAEEALGAQQDALSETKRQAVAQVADLLEHAQNLLQLAAKEGTPSLAEENVQGGTATKPAEEGQAEQEGGGWIGGGDGGGVEDGKEG